MVATQGFKNVTFTLKVKLYAVHLWMRGKDKVVPGELYQCKSKAAEGHGADIAFSLAKRDNLQIEAGWRLIHHHSLPEALS